MYKAMFDLANQRVVTRGGDHQILLIWSKLFRL